MVGFPVSKRALLMAYTASPETCSPSMMRATYGSRLTRRSPRDQHVSSASHRRVNSRPQLCGTFGPVLTYQAARKWW
jgi:hypothetical protein